MYVPMLTRFLDLFRPSPAVRDAAAALIDAHGAEAPAIARLAAAGVVEPGRHATADGIDAWRVVGEVERRLGIVRQADTATRWLERS